MTNIQKPNSEIAKIIEVLQNDVKVEPILEDIFLIELHVAGLYYAEHIDDIFPNLKKGDHLELFREDNKHDKHAILVKFKGKKIGYVPRKDNYILSKLMDAGKALYGVIEEVSCEPSVYGYEDDYKSVKFKVFLKE